MIEMPGTSYRGELPPADEALLSLAAELRQDVTRLAVDIGERNVQNCPQQLAQAADCVTAQFKAAGYDVRRQEYKVRGISCRNLEAEILGTTRPEEIVIVGATTTRYPARQGPTTIRAALPPRSPSPGGSPVARPTARFVSWRS